MRIKMIEQRKKLRLSQQQVADYLGKARSTISSYELGKREPSLVDIIKLKTLFKVKDDSVFLDETDTQSIGTKQSA